MQTGSAIGAGAGGEEEVGGMSGRQARAERSCVRQKGGLMAKCSKETSGRMQRPPELVPIHEYLLGNSLVPPEGFGRLRKAPES